MQVFAIAPAAMKGFVVLWGVVVLALSIALGMVALATSGARTARFEISSEGLRLRGDLYGRLIPIDALRIDQARRVELDATSEPAL